MRCRPGLTLWLFLCLAISSVSTSLKAQDVVANPVEEVAINEAAGRVVIAVVNGGILIGTIENQIEAGTRPPVPTEINANRAGVILGAVEWTSPSSQSDLARLDLDLSHLRDFKAAAGTAGEAPHLGVASVPGGLEASDIQAIGDPLRDRIAALAGDIHSKLDWPASEPVVELLLADYVADYGPEVWQITYGIEQEQQHGDFWVTNIDHPVYLQIWPPEKGQPHTLMEFDYPPENVQPSILDSLRRKDPKLDLLTHSDPKMRDVANSILEGDTRKVSITDATQFLRAALDAVRPEKARETVSLVRQTAGFQWILPPPPEPKKDIPQQPARPSDAPTLVHPSPDAPSLAKPPNSR